MKKVFALILALLMLLSLCSCVAAEDPVNYDLIKKYGSSGTYYGYVYDDIEVKNFGQMFSAVLYDVTESESSIQYYYAYEGKEAAQEGEHNRQEYMEYLGEIFAFSQVETDSTGMFSYRIAEGKEKDFFVQVIKYEMTSTDGLMVAINVPKPQATSDSAK